MNRARNQFFPGTRLAAQQDGRSGSADNLDLVQDFAQRGALADDILEVVFRLNFGFEIQALVFQAISRGAESSIRERIVQREGNLRADLGQNVEVFLSKVVGPLAPHGHKPKRSIRGAQGGNRHRSDRFGLQSFENLGPKLVDILLRPDLSSSGTHILNFLIGDFTDRNVGKKALTTGEIENRALELFGVFIDEPETGEVICKVFANRRRGGTEQLINVQLRYNLIVDLEQQSEPIALPGQLPLVGLCGIGGNCALQGNTNMR